MWLDPIKKIKVLPREMVPTNSPMQEPGAGVIRSKAEGHIIASNASVDHVTADLQT